MRIEILTAIFLALLVRSAQAEQTIQVCLIPLKSIVFPEARLFVGNLQHIFVRGADGTGLNFEPEDPMQFWGGNARIGRQNYSGADCRNIFATDDNALYQKKWDEIVEAYEDAAKEFKYRFFDINCQFITRRVLNMLGYSMPEEILEKLNQQ